LAFLFSFYLFTFYFGRGCIGPIREKPEPKRAQTFTVREKIPKAQVSTSKRRRQAPQAFLFCDLMSPNQ
jgi:hypothetical protein